MILLSTSPRLPIEHTRTHTCWTTITMEHTKTYHNKTLYTLCPNTNSLYAVATPSSILPSVFTRQRSREHYRDHRLSVFPQLTSDLYVLVSSCRRLLVWSLLQFLLAFGFDWTDDLIFYRLLKHYFHGYFDLDAQRFFFSPTVFPRVCI